MTVESDGIVAATATRIFADLADPQTVNRTKNSQWKAPLWDALAEAGLTRAWIPDHLGGAGGDMADGFAILGVAGRYAAPVPLAETLLAGWLLAQAGLDVPDGAMTVAPSRPNDALKLNANGTVYGRARGIAFASNAEHIALLADSEHGSNIALVKVSDCRLSDGVDLAGDPSNTVEFNNVVPLQCAPAPASFDRTSLLSMGATARSVQMAGALETILSLSVAYADERVAFERKIGKFQAVQQNLARLAGETAAALAAAGSAADTIAQPMGKAAAFDNTLLLEVAAAKIRCGEAAAEGAAIAHQVHGAIGFTNEHVLHRFTLRLLAWRDDFGSESYWAARLGAMIAQRGGDNFWPLLASR